MDDGLVTRPSPVGASATLARLRAEIDQRGLTVFGVIDHAAAARSAGLDMKAATVVVFGSPKVGTPLMRIAPTLAIDLPLKVLVWDDDTGATWMTYDAPAGFVRRHVRAAADIGESVWEAEGGAAEGAPGSAAADESHHDLGPIAGPLIAAMAGALAAITDAATVAGDPA